MAAVRNEAASYACIHLFPAFIAVLLREESYSLDILLARSPPSTPVLVLAGSVNVSNSTGHNKTFGASTSGLIGVTSLSPIHAKTYTFLRPISLDITATGSAGTSISSFLRYSTFFRFTVSGPLGSIFTYRG